MSVIELHLYGDVLGSYTPIMSIRQLHPHDVSACELHCYDYRTEAATGAHTSVAVVLGSYTLWCCTVVPSKCLLFVTSSPLHPYQRGVSPMMCVSQGYAPMVSAMGGGRVTPRLLVPGSETSVNVVLLYPMMSV